MGRCHSRHRALDLVFDLKGRSEQHLRLKQEYYGILAGMELIAKPNQKRVRRWRAKLIRLTADEPRTYRALDAVAYNAAVDALGRDQKDRLCIPMLVGLCCHFYDFKNYRFETMEEKNLRVQGLAPGAGV